MKLNRVQTHRQQAQVHLEQAKESLATVKPDHIQDEMGREAYWDDRMGEARASDSARWANDPNPMQDPYRDIKRVSHEQDRAQLVAGLKDVAEVVTGPADALRHVAQAAYHQAMAGLYSAIDG